MARGIVTYLIAALMCFCLFFLMRCVYWKLTIGAYRRNLILQYGCKPIRWRPTKDPLLGLDFLWNHWKHLKAHTALQGTQQNFISLGSNITQFRLLGQTIIATIEPEIVKTVLASDFKSFCLPNGRKKLLVPLLGKGIFTSDGEAWQHSRDMLRPNFVRSQLVQDLTMFEKHVVNLIQTLPKNGSTVDLQDLFFSFTLDLATDFLFGESTYCLVPGSETGRSVEFVKSFNYCQIFGVNEDDQNILTLFLPNRKFERGCKLVQEFADALIERALTAHCQKSKTQRDGSVRGTFLSQLSAETTDKVRIRSELLNLLLAGRDSTAALMSNVFFELSRHPGKQARLRREIKEHVGSDLPTFDGIKSMKYLRAILNESLRIHPIVPENSREAVRDTVLPFGGGEDGKSAALVKKGQLIAWSAYTMHRREDLYGEDASHFKPERWLDDEHGNGEKGLRVGWEYLPFNGGPRICIGQQFALLEASYVIIRILQSFSDIESRDAEPWREKLTLTCMSYGGCKVALTPRSN